MSTLPKILLVGSIDIDARLELMHYLARDFDVSALGSSTSLHEKFSAEGFQYTSYTLSRRANPFLDFLTLIQLFFIFRRLKPQLVHAFDTKPSVLARIAARMAGVPVVIGTLPGLGSLYVNDGFINRILRSIYQLLQKIACYLSDLTMFQNKDDADQFIKDGIVSSQKVLVIPGSGVSTELFSQIQVSEGQKTSLMNELGIQPPQVVITMISRIIKSKGVFEFMEAAQQVKSLYPNAHFLLVGPVDNESMDRLSVDELDQLRGVVLVGPVDNESMGRLSVNELKQLERAVIWLGPRKDIAALLAVSNIFVLPSAYREGIPRVLLEAASMGLPIITTDSPGCRDVVENNVNGILVAQRDSSALGQAMLRLIQEPDLRQRFGQISRQRAVDDFDSATIAGRIHTKYQQLLKRQAPALEY